MAETTGIYLQCYETKNLRDLEETTVFLPLTAVFRLTSTNLTKESAPGAVNKCGFIDHITEIILPDMEPLILPFITQEEFRRQIKDACEYKNVSGVAFADITAKQLDNKVAAGVKYYEGGPKVVTNDM